ncbi:glycerophosphodiester phosphodiesterase family protein [Jannaschia sp. W003]|uniref:glycerophosphodiester phosphodiesterase family protein n=1 Tax=Jannaschia sp. W003 TaxID=2867012 RepID=UPI0021A47E87|nr:glycerophosphodiester phosphodiesterase family protein [Jannaschia sp. W003]UWQ21626.1 phosphodiesterase [Jannaschia sp. W003]
MTLRVPLPPAFLHPGLLAHRGLHGPGVPENSRAAFAAALEAGYGIELDLQRTADGVALAFHDDMLRRLTGTEGRVRERSAAEMAALPLLGGGGAGAPTLAEVLQQVAGRVPLLIEIKDQDGALGADVGPLEEAVAALLRDYGGPVAVMSFNPHAVAAMAELAPAIPRGLVTDAFAPRSWPGVPEARLAELRAIGDVARTGAAFLSHDHRDLANPRVAALRDAGLPILCWTVRSAAEEQAARAVARAVTFEGYRP